MAHHDPDVYQDEFELVLRRESIAANDLWQPDFAAETDAGGADASSVDHDSYDNAVIVEQGDELGTLTITAVNTFNTPPVPPKPTPPNPFHPPGPDSGASSAALSYTGFPAGQWVLIGFALFALGAGLVSGTRAAPHQLMLSPLDCHWSQWVAVFGLIWRSLVEFFGVVSGRLSVIAVQRPENPPDDHRHGA
jgi:hypothetical protein